VPVGKRGLTYSPKAPFYIDCIKGQMKQAIEKKKEGDNRLGMVVLLISLIQIEIPDDFQV